MSTRPDRSGGPILPEPPNRGLCSASMRPCAAFSSKACPRSRSPLASAIPQEPSASFLSSVVAMISASAPEERFFQAIRRGPQSGARPRSGAGTGRRPAQAKPLEVLRYPTRVGQPPSAFHQDQCVIDPDCERRRLRLDCPGFGMSNARRPPSSPKQCVPSRDAPTCGRSIWPRAAFAPGSAVCFVFVPLMRSIDLGAVLQPPRLPGSQMIPAEQAVRTLLALKLLGIERKSHVMDCCRIAIRKRSNAGSRVLSNGTRAGRSPDYGSESGHSKRSSRRSKTTCSRLSAASNNWISSTRRANLRTVSGRNSSFG